MLTWAEWWSGLSKRILGFILTFAGLAFFGASIYFMNSYNVLASIMAAVLGFTSISIGVDLVREA